MSPGDTTTGICLLYMGGPQTLEEVEPFLLELFSDRRLIQLPAGRLLQGPLARIISRRRAPVVRERYARIGGGSPLVRITMQQAALLQTSLRRRGDYHVEVGMRYTPPRADEALANLSRRGISRLVALPLYPHYSGATTGSSFADLDRALAASGLTCPVRRVDDYHDHPGYLDALSSTVRRGLESMGGGDATVLFSAHALPQKMIDRGDPYERQVEATVAGVVERLALPGWRLGYQSRSGPVRWMKPDVLELITELGGRGCRRLLVVPVSFVSDHIETLHEIDIEMKDHALARGIENFARAPALNDDSLFIEALTRIIIDAC